MIIEDPNPTLVVMSPGLEAALAEELALRPVEGPEAMLIAGERVYAAKGEAPFDPLNSADTLCRAFIFAEAHDAANARNASGS